MTRSSLLTGLLGFVAVGAIGALPLACQGGGVGDPCTPEEEYDPQFAGFKVTLENIESRSFQCQTRICLVNHFQGRVSCPLGQGDVTSCTKLDSDGSVGPSDCDDDRDCVETAKFAKDCDPKLNEGNSNPTCAGGALCDPEGKFCHCDSSGPTPPRPPTDSYKCDTKTHQFRSFVCHTKGECQTADSTEKENCGEGGQPKDCCVPGTDQPVGVPVCGQCSTEDGSNRDAKNAVYCSCRCDAAEGRPKDPNFNFCTCPTGFTCSEIRPYVGLGDEQITGKYCIRQGTDFSDSASLKCSVNGSFNASCDGISSTESACGGS